MAGTCIRLILVVVLCFTYLICLNGATPVTRSINLVQKSGSIEVGNNAHMENVGEDVKTEATIIRRMDIELNDYPGSGANNRHTPRPQLGRGCPDC